VPVAAGPVVIAVTGTGRATGAYRLETSLVAGYLENPSPNSYQSGIGVISGWVCEAEGIDIVFNPGTATAETWRAGYPATRTDTASTETGEVLCGATANGFGLLYNWTHLEDREHVVVARVDGEELGRAVVRVTTLGEEVMEDVAGACVVADFPREGETVWLEW